MPRLPNPHVPILLVDIRGRREFAHYGTSRVNYEEQEVVLELVKRLRNILGDRVSIAVLSPYLTQTIELKDMLEGYHCFVRTVDSFVGQVADVVILSTVQSWVKVEDDVKREKRLLEHNEFFTHVGRALSAISRPVHAFFMVGNMDAIAVNEVYRRFLHFARRRTTVMKGAYFGVHDAAYEYEI
ncbi:RNA helicase [Aphelenchoides avenae]|nr:RNA helicase [Aphelenchus avenae]